MDRKGLQSILDDMEDEEMTKIGRGGLDDPQAGPKGDGGQSNDSAGPADPDGSNDNDPTVEVVQHAGGPNAEHSGEPSEVQDDDFQDGGESKLSDLVKTLSAQDKATLLKLLG